MKTETEMLHDWIAEQREIYQNSHFESDEKKLEAIDRLLILQEVRMQLIIFEKLTSDAVIESWNEKNKMPDYMLISDEQRKLFDEVFENRTAK